MSPFVTHKMWAAVRPRHHLGHPGVVNPFGDTGTQAARAAGVELTYHPNEGRAEAETAGVA
jgi:hypothetical protein